MRISRPPKDTYLCLHEWILLVKRFTKGSQVEAKRGFSPIIRPRYLKGRDYVLQWKKSQERSKKAWSQFKLMR